jgi:hypothetical protein
VAIAPVHITAMHDVVVLVVRCAMAGRLSLGVCRHVGLLFCLD